MKKNLWLLPALASALFFAFSVYVMISHGPLGFIDEHTRNAGWALQIAIDLVSAGTVALFFAAPYAKKYGITLWPWVVLTYATGSIGLFAFAARLRYAYEAAENTASLGRTAEKKL